MRSGRRTTGSSLSARSDKGKTALQFAASHGKAEVVRLLLAKGAEVDPRDKTGHTPLMLAANYGCNRSSEVLINAGADLFAVSQAGSTALAYAENNRHPETLAILLKSLRSNS